MSASYLVADRQRAWLLGMGCQRMVVEDQRFRYQGGFLPVSCPGAELEPERAIASVPGLWGFVGIDFVWNPEDCEATVLELNPRPTTSIVGLSRLLPPGHLAAAWLAACGVPVYPGDLPAHLKDIVNRQPAIWFTADGTLCDRERGEHQALPFHLGGCMLPGSSRHHRL